MEERGGVARGSQSPVMARALRELGMTAPQIVYLRASIVSFGALGLAGAILVFDPEEGRLLQCAGILGVLAWFSWRDLAEARQVGAARSLWRLHFRSAFLYLLLVLASGGILSPLLAILVPTSLLMGLRSGDRRSFALGVVWTSAVVWSLALLEYVFHPDWSTPTFYRPGPDLKMSGVWFLSVTIVLTISIAAGGFVALIVRQALDRALEAASDARREAVDIMRERNRELMSLTADLSHELKNPLASIRGLAILVSRKLDSGPDAERMRVLVQEVERMGSLLDTLLTFSRPLQPLMLNQVSPRVLLTDLHTLLDAQLREAGIGVVLELETTEPMEMDPRKVMQVMMNLALNAVEAMPTGGTLTLRALPLAEGGIRLEVQDTGSGISPAMRSRLFTPGITSRSAGSGLGLTLCRVIAEQHGGTLQLLDAPSGGCLARLQLPPHRPRTQVEGEDQGRGPLADPTRAVGSVPER